MANYPREGHNAAEAARTYFKSTGTGTDGDPYIPEVAGSAAVVTPTIAVSTSPAYSVGDSIGGKITLTGAVRISGGIALLTGIQILDRANQRPVGKIIIFNADPSVATLTDNAALVLSTDDLKIVATISIFGSDYVTVNSKALANIELRRQVKAASGTTLYAAFATDSTPTFAATTDLQIAFAFVHIN